MSMTFSKRFINIGMIAALTAVPSCTQIIDAIPGKVDDYSYPKPEPTGGELRADVFRARISNSLFDFVTSHIGDILAANGGNIEEVKDDSGKVQKKLVAFDISGFGSVKLDVTKLNENTSVSFEKGTVNGYPARLSVVLKDLDVYADVTYQGCQITGKNDGPLANIDNITLAVDLGVKKNSEGMRVLDISINGDSSSLTFGTGSIKGKVTGDGATCTGISILVGTTSFVTYLVDMFSKMFMPDLIKWASEQMNSAIGDIPLDILMGVDLPGAIAGMIGNDGLASMWVDPEPFGVKLAPNLEPLRVTQSGSDAGSRGLSFVLDAAFGGDKSTCIGEIEPPMYAAMTTTLPDYNGKVRLPDSEGIEYPENYDAVVTINQGTIAQIIYALMRSGTFCLRIDSNSLGSLIGGTISPTVGLFSTFAPELSYLAGSNAPVIISLRPTATPIVTMGKAEQYINDDGVVAFDSLIGVGLNELELNFFLFTENRYARMFTLSLDVNVGLTVESTNDAKLNISVDELRIDNFVTTFNDLAPHANLDELLDSILSMVSGSLLSDVLNFGVDLNPTLTQLFGQDVDLFFNAIRREPQEPNPDLPGHYLAIYATFCDESDKSNKKDVACYRAGHGGARPSDAAAISLAKENLLISKLEHAESIYGYELTGHPTGKVAFEATPGYEYRFKVDNGPWYSYRQPASSGKMVLKDGLLRLPGAHNIKVMARPIGGREEMALNDIKVLMDVVKPNLHSQLADGKLHIWADDLLNSAEQLKIRVRSSHDGVWYSIDDLESVVAAVRANNSSLEVVAADEAGNISTPLLLANSDLPGQVAAGAPVLNTVDSSGGCNSASGNGSWLALLAMMAVALRRKFAKN